ncbi:Holliday junction DNA helicase subunit RuvA [Filimonas lacunae]|uniref:Holliday junction branch migration complex subunit RuvA n=1 Tax=Filimonas lacunae TaxID=477680 RepID=A0A173M9K0_9BACT|nr:Holliday junction branch migration protein RuvA [Filimonas lacunae]BAV04190.1 Holliday junction DNA helicase RuvA [Filimonas lacunae]SIT14440.1 Holliday junction DNA helicase subunit RuvA [Filimonas lacunae]
MIAFVRGIFVHKTPAQVIVDVNGVGYDLHISLHTFSVISNMEKGQLYTYLHITENGQTLYGFYEMREKELFLQLISVSGVGASTARMMLSGMKPDEIVKAIVQSNAKQLEGIKGIGKKTAERLVLELKDKLNKQAPDLSILSQADAQQYSMESDALNALVSLGIARPTAEQALKKALKSNHPTEETTLESLIKLALKNI